MRPHLPEQQSYLPKDMTEEGYGGKVFHLKLMVTRNARTQNRSAKAKKDLSSGLARLYTDAQEQGAVGQKTHRFIAIYCNFSHLLAPFRGAVPAWVQLCRRDVELHRNFLGQGAVGQKTHGNIAVNNYLQYLSVPPVWLPSPECSPAERIFHTIGRIRIRCAPVFLLRT